MTMSVDQLESRVSAFEQKVAKHFGWLEREHGFHRGDCRVRDVDEPRDGAVSVRFKRADLTIEIGMALYYDKAGLVIRDPNWHLKPEPHVKWLTLEDLLGNLGKPWSPKPLDSEFEELERHFRLVQSDVLEPDGVVFARSVAERGRG